MKLADFATVWEVKAWVEARWGIAYSYEGMRSVLKRNDLGVKVRARNRRKPICSVQATWQKSLESGLIEADCTQSSGWYFSDEMRFGLWGQVRRRWGLRGAKIVQPKQIVFAWRYRVLAVDVVHLDLKGDWSQRMNQAHLMPIFEHWALETVIWDGATAHRGQAMARLDMQRIFCPVIRLNSTPQSVFLKKSDDTLRGWFTPRYMPNNIALTNSCDDCVPTKHACDNWSPGTGL